MLPYLWTGLAGTLAGCISGILGAGGGMILVPILRKAARLEEKQIFPSSLTVMLPVCFFSLLSSPGPLPWQEATPYLIGSLLGGIGAGIWGRNIPAVWLHRMLGTLILWGGIRYLC